MKKGTMVFIACLTLVFAFGTVAEAGYKIIHMPKNLGNPYFDACDKGAQEAGKELGDEVVYTAPSDADATKQIQMINALIAQKVDGMMISANDNSATLRVFANGALNTGMPACAAPGKSTWFVPIQKQPTAVRRSAASMAAASSCVRERMPMK